MDRKNHGIIKYGMAILRLALTALLENGPLKVEKMAP